MNANDITTDRLADLACLVDLAAASLRRLHQDAVMGDVGQEEASAEVREILANIAAFQP